MKLVQILAIFSLVLVAPLSPSAYSFDRDSSAPSVTTQQTALDESQLETHKTYINKDGKVVHSPSKSKTGEVPDGATALCNDSTYSFSLHHRGTCSHHGGVARWLN